MYIWSKLILFWKTWPEGVGKSRIPSKDPQRPRLGNPSTCPFVSLVEHDEQGVGSSRIASKDPQSPGLGNPSTCPLCVRREGVGRSKIPSKDPQSLQLGNPSTCPFVRSRQVRRITSTTCPFLRVRQGSTRQEHDFLKRSSNPWIGQSIYLPIRKRQTRGGRQVQDSLNYLPILKRQTRGSRQVQDSLKRSPKPWIGQSI